MTGGDSIGGRAEELRSVAGSVPSGLAAEVAEASEQIRDQLADIIGDSVEVVGLAHQQVEEANGLFRTLVALREALHSVSGYHSGAAPAGGSAGPGAGPAPSAPSAPAGPSPVTAPDGSQYPAAAEWAVRDGLPRRVQRGAGEPTTGFIRINDVPIRVQSGDDPYSDMVDQRLQDMGVRRSSGLRRHVEMKIAAMLTRSQDQHQEVVINHAPCGSEPGESRGCDAMLEPFLPAGRSLTVHGTTADGKPFSRTYHGKGT